MKKKLLSLALALVMCLGLAVPAMAEEAQNDGFKQTAIHLLRNNYIFEGGIVRVDADYEEFHVTRNGAATMEWYMAWVPETIYIPRGSKVSLTSSAINAGYQMLVYTPGFQPTVIAADITSYQFNNSDPVQIGIYTDHKPYDSYAVYSHINVATVDEPAAKMKTPFSDIGYFDEGYRTTNQSGKSTCVAIPPEYRADIEWAYEQGIVSGTSATTFSSLSAVTRAQLVQMLWNYSGKPEPQSTYVPFPDVKVTGWYYKALCWACETGVLNEVFLSEDFSPDEFCTPYQAVLALNNLFHCQLPNAIRDEEITAKGPNSCLRANFAHYLHYAYQYSTGALNG